MHRVAKYGFVLAALAMVVGGCSKDETQGVDVGTRAGEAGVGGAGAQAVEETGYSGQWAMLQQSFVLEPGGTGRFESMPVWSGTQELTWREEGDALVVSMDGEEFRATLSGSGECLFIDDPASGRRYALVRVPDEATGDMGPAQGIDAEVMREAQSKAKQAACASNLKLIALAAVQYSSDYDFHHPPASAVWADVFEPYLKNRQILLCPEDDETPSYAYSAYLRGLTELEVPRPAETIMLFESDDDTDIAHRHREGANYGFADGHVKWLKAGAENQPTILWDLD